MRLNIYIARFALHCLFRRAIQQFSLVCRTYTPTNLQCRYLIYKLNSLTRESSVGRGAAFLVDYSVSLLARIRVAFEYL